MNMKQFNLTYRNERWAVFFLLLFFLVPSCTQEEQPITSEESDIPIRVYTSTRNDDASAGQGEAVKARLIFWRKNYYEETILHNNEWAPPYLAITPDEEIDYYSVDRRVPFNTKNSYPTGSALHVMGYAPADLTSRDNYKTLTIPDAMQDGKTDFLSGDGNSLRIGSAEKPFEVIGEGETDDDLKNRELKFCHLTSKILVQAKRHENTYQRYTVRNISVTIKEQEVPTTLEWKVIDKETLCGGYFPANRTDKKNIELQGPSDYLLYEVTQAVDSCYVYPTETPLTHAHEETTEVNTGTITLKLDISAEILIYTSEGFDTANPIQQKWTDQEVTIQTKTGNELKMGYKYVITLKFDIYGIQLQAVEMDWDDGGLHFIPITPTTDTGN